MTQIISKDGVVKCTTTVPYSSEEIKMLKKAGYTVKVINDDKKADNKDE